MRSSHATKSGRVGSLVAVAIVMVLGAAGAALVPGGVASAMTSGVAPNWAGYTALGSYHSASTSLVVPSASCSPGENSSSSFWVGLDGLQSSTVEQDGVEVACQGGAAAYWAWWEMYGGAGTSGAFSIPVRPGDTVSVSVANAGAGMYAFTVTDSTRHEISSVTERQVGAADNSAECIAEDPGGDGGPVPYTNYGTVTFSSCLVGGAASSGGTVVVGGTPIASTNLVLTTGITQGNGVDAAVSPITAGGAFTVTREFPPVYTPPLAGAAVSMAAMPDGGGYWLVNGAGAITAHGAAGLYGSMAGQPLVSPIAHIVSTPSGRGYWMVAADGGVFSFGDAGFYGSMGASHLNAPVVDIASTLSGRGYWLVASDGGIFAFGDAQFAGSMGGSHLNEPVVGLAADPVTGGYWLVASDGGVFAFGAPFYGSMGGSALNAPIESLDATSSGHGYRFVAPDGGVFSFGDAAADGNLSGSASPVTGMAEDWATGGYWLLTSDGTVSAFDATWYGSR